MATTIKAKPASTNLGKLRAETMVFNNSKMVPNLAATTAPVKEGVPKVSGVFVDDVKIVPVCKVIPKPSAMGGVEIILNDGVVDEEQAKELKSKVLVGLSDLGYSSNQALEYTELEYYYLEDREKKTHLLIDGSSLFTTVSNRGRWDDDFGYEAPFLAGPLTDVMDKKVGYGIVINSQLTDCQFLRRSNLVMNTTAKECTFSGSVLLCKTEPRIYKKNAQITELTLHDYYHPRQTEIGINTLIGCTIQSSNLRGVNIQNLNIRMANITRCFLKGRFGTIHDSVMENCKIDAANVTVTNAEAVVRYETREAFILRNTKMINYYLQGGDDVNVGHISCLMDIKINRDGDPFRCYTSNDKMHVMIPYSHCKDHNKNILSVALNSESWLIDGKLREMLHPTSIFNLNDAVSTSIRQYITQTLANRMGLISSMRTIVALAPDTSNFYNQVMDF